MTSVEDVTADVVETAEELELEAGLQATELLQPHERTWTEKELLLRMSRRWNLLLVKML